MTDTTKPESAAYCAKCNAPTTKNVKVWLSRCGGCFVKNGKLPPSKYQPLTTSAAPDPQP